MLYLFSWLTLFKLSSLFMQIFNFT